MAGFEVLHGGDSGRGVVGPVMVVLVPEDAGAGHTLQRLPPVTTSGQVNASP